MKKLYIRTSLYVFIHISYVFSIFQRPIIKIKEKYLSLEAYGFASTDSGPHKYGFELDLFEAIDVSESQENVHLSGSQLTFVLTKADVTNWWPRLTAQPQKQDWINVDEVHWISPPADTVYDTQKEYRDIRVDYPGVDDRINEAELGYRKMDAKAIYLFLYNLFQFIGYLFIFIVLGISYYRDGFNDSVEKAFRNVGNAMKFCQLLQYLEVMHPMFGYTKGSPLYPFLQVNGRNFILFCMVDAEVRIQTKPVILLLFLCWSIIECVRYPYYVLSLLKFEIGIVTWLRYTLWIPLYPIGAFLEGVVVLRNIPFFEETQKFTITMPNKWNCTFCMCTFMKYYLLLGLLPGIFFMMKYMAKVREKKLKTVKVRYNKKLKKK